MPTSYLLGRYKLCLVFFSPIFKVASGLIGWLDLFEMLRDVMSHGHFISLECATNRASHRGRCYIHDRIEPSIAWEVVSSGRATWLTSLVWVVWAISISISLLLALALRRYNERA